MSLLKKITDSGKSLSTAMKRLISRNKSLIAELAEKNRLIQQQSENEVLKLNLKLLENLKQLREHEFVLSQSQRIAKVGSWEFRRENSSLYWSDEMYNIFGLDRSFDISVKDLSQILWGDQSIILESSTNELLRTGNPYDLTLRAKTPLGHFKWMRLYGFPIRENETIIGVTGVCHDITYYKEAEELIKANERNYRALFDQASDAIMVTDFVGNFMDVNQGLCNMFGYTKDELVRMKITDLMDKDELNEKPILFDKLAMGDHVFSERKIIHKNGTVIYVEANVKMISDNRIIAISRNITERKQTEAEKERAIYLLNERVKELSALYRVSMILNEEQRPIEEVLQDITMTLPSAWQYPEITAASIRVNGAEYKTKNFGPGKHTQYGEFKMHDGSKGIVEIVYLEEKPEEVEGPFLSEERNLLDMMAEMIRVYLFRKYEEEALSNAQANLAATINNTEILIWSVDYDFNLVTFNRPFAAYVREMYGVELKLGARILTHAKSGESDELTKKWTQLYLRALAGELVKHEESRKNRSFHYSLSPIIEDNKVTGISIFAEDITERKIRAAELAEANKKIGELKLMALRSVMSPHFIFNVLNSIQFFIAKNDRVNAINYLSTFSKLIRSVLTHSVSNKIKLSDEIDMLKNYVDLEKTRFENKFEFLLTMDPELDVDGIEIPSLLIQPYVENAILHGLYNKQEKGRLVIKVSEGESNVVFDIEDDGIGREAAQKLRAQNFPAHKSMGLKITEERLQQYEADFSIEDLITDGVASGTRVRISIKI